MMTGFGRASRCLFGDSIAVAGELKLVNLGAKSGGLELEQSSYNQLAFWNLLMDHGLIEEHSQRADDESPWVFQSLGLSRGARLFKSQDDTSR